MIKFIEFDNNFFIISIFLNISILTIYILIFKKYKDDKSIKLKNILYYILVGLTLSFILEISLSTNVYSTFISLNNS